MKVRGREDDGFPALAGEKPLPEGPGATCQDEQGGHFSRGPPEARLLDGVRGRDGGGGNLPDLCGNRVGGSGGNTRLFLQGGQFDRKPEEEGLELMGGVDVGSLEDRAPEHGVEI